MAETQVSREDFVSSFSQLLRAGDTEIVYVRGDSLAVYADVLAVIATVAQTEGVRLGLIAEPWTGR